MSSHFDDTKNRFDGMDRVGAFLYWAVECFGSGALMIRERVYRFAEEAIELAQAAGCTEEEVMALVRRVFKKAPGPLLKETSQCALLLEAVCRSAHLQAPDKLAEIEWQRVQTVSTEEWRRRHAAKVIEGIATGALPAEMK